MDNKTIIEDFEKYVKAHFIENKKEEIKQVKNDNNSRKDNLEKRFASVIFWVNGKEDEFKEIGELISLFEGDIGKDTLQGIIDSYKPFSENLVLEMEMLYENKKEIIVKDVEEVVLNLEEEILKEQSSALLIKINEKEKNGDKNDISKDLTNYQKRVEKIEDIKNRRVK